MDINVTFTNPQLIALGVMTLISYGMRVPILLSISALGIGLYSVSIASENLPLSVLVFVFAVATLAYGWVK